MSATAVGDVTCDGRADLVATYSSFDDATQTWGTHLDVWPGGSDGSLGAVRSVVPPTDGVSDLATGDVTGDGCADVVLANGDVWVLAGASSGLRAATRLRTVTGVGAVEIADLTGDRANDLVVGNGTVTLLAGNGKGGFAKPKVLVPAQVDRFDVGDLDGDGRRIWSSAPWAVRCARCVRRRPGASRHSGAGPRRRTRSASRWPT